jgi:hypothetical protein
MIVQELRQKAKARKINITANGRYKSKEQLLAELGESGDAVQNKKVKQIVIPASSKPTVININMTQNNNSSHQISKQPDAVHHNVNISAQNPSIPIPKAIVVPERFERQEIPRMGESEEDRIAREETVKSLAYARSRSTVSANDLSSAMLKRRKAIAGDEKGGFLPLLGLLAPLAGNVIANAISGKNLLTGKGRRRGGYCH